MSTPGKPARRPVRKASPAPQPVSAPSTQSNSLDAEPRRAWSEVSPFLIGFLLALGALVAFWLTGLIMSVGGTLVLVAVSFFLAAGLNPAVEFFERRRLPRSGAVAVVIGVVLAAIALFVVALVPVLSDQVAALVANAPDWLSSARSNGRVADLDERFDLIAKATDFMESSQWASTLGGGVLGLGMAVLSGLMNAFIVVVLTLYFLASMEKTKASLYALVPASKRDTFTSLADRMLAGVGGYVSGAFIVSVCAGLFSLAFLFIVGLGEYAVALSLVVALLAVIPMVGATIAAVVVTAIGFATSPGIGVACLVFYVIYQQVENYLIYPRVMKRSVDVPGVVTVIAALLGAGLLGVIGAMMAVPVAAALLLLIHEVWTPRADRR